MIDAREIPALRLEVARLRDTYKAQRSYLRSLPAGRRRGMAGHKLSLIGKEGRLLADKLRMIEDACKERGVLV